MHLILIYRSIHGRLNRWVLASAFCVHEQNVGAAGQRECEQKEDCEEVVAFPEIHRGRSRLGAGMLPGGG